MANVGRLVDIQDGNTALTGTQTATITTDGWNPGDARNLGIWVKISSPVSLTSVIITLELSVDGTNYTELTAAANTSAQATVKTLSAADDAYEWWEVRLPGGDNPNLKVRSVWTLVGTSYDVDVAKWVVLPD